MGRNNTKAIKSIKQMYQANNLDCDKVFHKSKLLLTIYRDVVWVSIQGANKFCEEATEYYYSNELTDALEYLNSFAPDEERERFENRINSLFKTKWMIDLIDNALYKIYEYHNNGKLYHEILSKSYLTVCTYTEPELLEAFNMERSTFYDRKREAVLLFGVALWGYAIPQFKGIFETDTINAETPDYFQEVRPMSD